MSAELFELIDDLNVGRVVEVSGTTVRVELSGNVTDLHRTFQGRVYPIGQIGSLVKIHYGRRLIFGMVSMLRMRSEELEEYAIPIPAQADQRIMEIELFSEGTWSVAEQKLDFMRGIKTYPLPRQGVYLLTKDEANALYEAAESAQEDDNYNPLVSFADYAGVDNTPCRANIDKMFGMHCAVLGSTGSGKSGAVAALVHSLFEHQPDSKSTMRPRIVIIDPHGEYSHAFSNRAVVYRAYDPIGTDTHSGIPIQLPYWLMSADELRQLIIGKTEEEATSQNNIIYKALTHARMEAAGLVDSAPITYERPVPTDGLPLDAPRPKEGVKPEELQEFDFDKPRPFCLDEFRNHIYYAQASRIHKQKISAVSQSEFGQRFRSILDKLAVLRRDPRLRFLMNNWEKGAPSLGNIIAQFVGEMTSEDEHPKDLRIVDISGLPNEVAGPLTGMLARLLFNYKVYQDEKERERDPILLVCEEAHRYVPDRGEAEYATAQTSIRRIAREGRKYGVGLMLVSQRPSDVESTVIAQCATWVILRLANATDQQHVSRFLPDGLSGMARVLPNLAQQEAIFVGEGAALPSRIRVRDLSRDQLPRSETAKFAKGWSLARLSQEEIDEVAKRLAGKN